MLGTDKSRRDRNWGFKGWSSSFSHNLTLKIEGLLYWWWSGELQDGEDELFSSTCVSSLSQSLRCTKSLRPTLDRKSHTSERQEVREWFGGKIDQLEHIFNVTPTLLVREFWAIEILSCFTPSKREMSNKCKQHPLKSIQGTHVQRHASKHRA